MEDNLIITDIDKYKKYLDNLDLTDDQKTDIVIIVASTCDHFVDEAFNGPSKKTFDSRYRELKKNLSETPERIRTKHQGKINKIDE